MIVDPVRLGVIGLGRGFMLSLPALKRHPWIQLVAGADPRPAAGETLAAEFDCAAYQDIQALLADPAVEAVYIASPHGLHAEQTIAALSAGKHVLVEKPMALSLQECRAMTEAAVAADRVLMVGPSHGFDAPVQRAAALVASGQYGAPKIVTAFNYTDFMYRFRRPEELDQSRGGGVVFSQAAHQIDQVRTVVGAPVRSVRATSGQWDPERPSDGAYSAFLSFANGASATLTYSGYGRYDTDELVGWISELGFPRDPDDYGLARRRLAAIGGEDEAAAKLTRAYGHPAAAPLADAPHHEHFGFVLVSCERADLRITPTGVWIYGDDARWIEPIEPPAIPRAGVFDAFIEAVRSGRSAPQDGAWGAHIMACCEALLRSSAEAREIFLD